MANNDNNRAAPSPQSGKSGQPNAQDDARRRANRARYLPDYSIEVVEVKDDKGFKRAMPVCCHRFGTTREIPCLALTGHCPHRAKENDYSRGRERTRECG
jgi:hypothetical protein